MTEGFTMLLPDTVCRDGWHSSSAGPGTCSYHGGVNYNYSGESSTPDGAWVILALGIIIWTVAILYFNSYKVSRWWRRKATR